MHFQNPPRTPAIYGIHHHPPPPPKPHPPRFVVKHTQVPIDQLYWGWNALGNWVRVSLLVKEAGNYTASVFGTCNSGGQLTLTVDDYDGKAAGEGEVRLLYACAFIF